MVTVYNKSSLFFCFACRTYLFKISLVVDAMSENDLSPPYNQSHVDVQHEEDQVSLSSDATQTGVKNIEVISQTWTRSSLIAAYLGWV